MGRHRRRDRRNHHRFRLGWLGNGRNGRTDGGDKRRDGYRSSLYATLRCHAEQAPEQLVLLKKEGSYKREDFVVKAGWVKNVNEKYRSAVAEACASTIVEAMEAKPAG